MFYFPAHGLNRGLGIVVHLCNGFIHYGFVDMKIANFIYQRILFKNHHSLSIKYFNYAIIISF